MIFLTVGTQLPFDRLVSAVDTWAQQHPDVEVIGQIGPSSLSPSHMRSSQFLNPKEADGLFRKASLVVAHAGMGSILTALKYRKPILIVPRKAQLGEHRNEHQMATAKWLQTRPGVFVAWDTVELAKSLDARQDLTSGDISDFASADFTEKLRQFMLE